MKSERQAKILEIIASKEVETQEQLLLELKNAGYDTTQATISRDIKELRVVKELSPAGRYRYASNVQDPTGPVAERLHKIFRECVTSVDSAQNQVVIKTLPGLANAAGSAVDSMQLPSLLGSLAGDDTLLLILRDTASAAGLCAEICSMLK